MTNFNTISELEILNIAWRSLIDKWKKEEEIVKNNPEMFVAKYRASKYRAQAEEISLRIIELGKTQ